MFPGDPAINASDAPDGLYIVWDKEPGKGIALPSYSIATIRDSTTGFLTPEEVFNKNKDTKDIPLDQLPHIFPTPVSYIAKPGQFLLTASVPIDAGGFDKEASYLSSQLFTVFGKQPVISATAPTGNQIIFRKKELPEEAYHLAITEKEIVIEAASGAGVFYGIQSLRSMMPASAFGSKQTGIALPCAEVNDAPRFSFRSLMVDVARNFQTKQELLKVIGLMAQYKLNALHLHAMDDEGWRIEIPSLPELTEISARRGHTLDSKKMLPASFSNGPDPDHSNGTGFYTRADFIEILKYATDRHILVIPEIESPGHARAAIKAMDARYEKFMLQKNPETAQEYLLRDLNDRSNYQGPQLWNDNVICVALPSVYRFMEKVSDELIAMYKEAGAPITTIHMGGDEVPSGVWEQSPVCLEFIKNNKDVPTTDDLWYYYYTRLDELLKKRGLFLSGWEEVGLRKTKIDGQKQMIPNPTMANLGIHLHVWNNMIGWGAEDLPYRLANAGYKVVLSCVSNQYFDLAYTKSPEEPGYYWGGFTDIDKSFYFIPTDYYKNSIEDRRGNPVAPSYFVGKDRLTEYGKSNIVGLQGLIWGENMHGPDRFEYMLLPKFLGLAERSWAPDPSWATEKDPAKARQLYQDAWSVFINTVSKKELPLLDHYAGGYSYRIPPPGVIAGNGQLTANTQLPGFTIRYTTDGKEPGVQSAVYDSPVKSKGLIKFRTFDNRGRSSRTVEVKNN